jgi:type VI secretion system FHA domain protein
LTSGDRELLETMLAAAGSSQVELPNVPTFELAEMLGRILGHAIQGALTLHQSREAIKSGFSIPFSTFEPGINNPLKCSASVPEALVRMTDPRFPGYMEPTKAVSMALDDIDAHQWALVAGMQAAISAVLKAFDPSQLEARFERNRWLGELLSMPRKAKAWDLFRERYGAISEEARDGFNRTFGEEFGRAYVAQLGRLRAARVDRDKIRDQG